VYALTISSESWVASSGSSGAIRMPPSAASWAPNTQATWLDRSGSAPVSPASARSSTVARICVPIRGPCSSARSAIATAIATIIVISSCQVIAVEPS
jgi:hypothetical protein